MTDQIKLQFGDPFPGSFPNRQLGEALVTALGEEPEKVLQYGSGRAAADLRTFLLDRADVHGMQVRPEELQVTAGASEALDLISRTLLNPGDLIFTEAPTFMGALTIFRNFAAEIRGIDVDAKGLNTDLLADELRRRKAAEEPLPKFIYTIPNFQNPTGVTMTKRRREDLLQLASEFNFLVIQDDAYGELRLHGDPVPSLWEMDEEGRVLHVGTFSKTLAPGLRLGWIYAAEELIEQIGAIRPGYGNGASESLAAVYCRGIDFDERVAGLRQIYRERRNAMLKALDEFMPEAVSWNPPEGGLFVWLQIYGDVDTRGLVDRAAAEGVAVLDGSIFYPQEAGGSFLRLSYSLEPVDRLREAVRILAEVIAKSITQD